MAFGWFKCAQPKSLSTLGTTGGPVSALNTNVLKTSDFMTSAFAPEYGNALGGVFDLGIRNGNNSKREHMFQFGAFSGFEFLTEGPINKKKKSSYIIAYRYAFTSFAQAAGIPIGTAATPNYQDLTFKINGGLSKFGRFSLFGIGGYSHIDFLSNEIDSRDVFADPTRNSYSKSKIAALGASHVIPVGKQSTLKTILGFNTSFNSFDSDSINAINNEPARIIELKNVATRFTINSAINTKINNKFSIKSGVIGELLMINLFSQSREFTSNWETGLNTKENTMLLQEYIQGKYNFTANFFATGGLHFQQLFLNSTSAIEPRLALKYKTLNFGNFSAGYGLHQQMQTLDVYFYKQPNGNGTYNNDNEQLEFSKSTHYVLGHEYILKKIWKFKTELYYQMLSNIPISKTPTTFSTLNEGASFFPTREGNLINSGTGTNKGFEFTIERYFTKGFYALITTSIYDSKYTASDLIERSTGFN